MSPPPKRTIHELRVIAQAFGVTDIFEKDAIQLAQAVELKQKSMAVPSIPIPPRNEYDARLMTKAPSRRSNQAEIESALSQHVALGLKITFDEESWQMAHGKRTDGGSIRMPLRHVLLCAEKVLRG